MRYKKVIIIDYGLGNLFSVERAFRYVGAETEIVCDPKKISEADYLVLPGVGAFGDGIKGLIDNHLIEPLMFFTGRGRPLLGICLGMQLLMTESEEFGRHEGLNMVPGKVVRLSEGRDTKKVRIPHVGWNSLLSARHAKGVNETSGGFWKDTILENTRTGMFFYFVHSYMVVPDNPVHILAETEYGENVFCSVLRRDNIFACQFHPERSGEVGLDIYKQFLRL